MAIRVRDLPAPVTACKSDWLPGTSWIGFTPTENDLTARNRCQSTIQRQFNNGYVIEYITEKFGDPNPGFENSPEYLTERQNHKNVAGRFIAVHKLRATSRPLEVILGPARFKNIQDMWAQDEKRNRWSVAFPIIESYEIEGQPEAKAVLGDASYRRLFAHSSATLRPMNDTERAAIQDLHLIPVAAQNAWIGIEDEVLLAEQSDVDPRVRRNIENDLTDSALEGVPKERRNKIRQRAAWIAHKFVKERQRSNTLFCDECHFEPSTRVDTTIVRARSLLDVHHKDPIAEGVRYTNVKDFSLLCPTCHRIEHAFIKAGIVRPTIQLRHDEVLHP
jgi:5-methylcytosine-specific restriction protein A